MGVIGSQSQAPTSKFVNPPNLATIPANTDFTVQMAINNVRSSSGYPLARTDGADGALCRRSSPRATLFVPIDPSQRRVGADFSPSRLQVNAASNYFSAPQQTNNQGIIIGSSGRARPIPPSMFTNADSGFPRLQATHTS
jgi:hypothetical protein